jgi:hypothetical protein
LFAWCRDELLPRLVAEDVVLTTTIGEVRIALQESLLPDDSLTDYKQGWLNVLISRHDDDGNVVDVVEASLRVGYLTGASFDAPAPGPELLKLTEEWVETWRSALRRGLTEAVAEHGFEALRYPEPSVPNLLRLVEFSSTHGTPPEPPVPLFDAEAITRGAALLGAPTTEDEAWIEAQLGDVSAQPMTALRLDNYLLVFGADRTRPPHYVSEIWLRWDETPDELVQVLLTDVWNPTTRWSVDGDAFAFRRFTQWLRAVLTAAGHDETYAFEPDQWDEDDKGAEVTLAEWLLFDERGDDEEMLDWRCEDYVVAAGHPVQGAAGMFGFGAEFVKKLEEGSHAAIWRRFLCDVIDPRFDYAGM